MESLQHLLDGFDTMVLGFLKNGNAAEVGVGKENAAVTARQVSAFVGEKRADRGTDHGVAHTHDVNAGDALAAVGVDALEVMENGFLPIGPIFFEEKLAVLGGRTFGESPVKRPDGA